MNAIEDTPAARGWAEVARAFPKPNAIVVISAHWVTDGVRVSANTKNQTIHDFGGFPETLQAIRYAAPSDPKLASRLVQLLAPLGVRLEETRGLDHGVWSVLVWMYPDADVPVLQVSLDRKSPVATHLAIGRLLAPLRDENVLILGSGNVVHNLRAFFSGVPTPWAETFDNFVVDRVQARDDLAVADYWEHPDAGRAAPDWDHFAPLLPVLGARMPDDTAHVFNRHLDNGISMTSFAFGLPR